MSRIDARFTQLRAAKRAGLITFIMGFDPDFETSLAILKALPAAGADLIEIGVPFSDPVADGSTIQAAGLRALASGATLKGILELVRIFRQEDTQTPIILMGYFNPIFCYGAENFARDAEKAGVDGVIVVDLPLEEMPELEPALVQHNIALIRLVAPTTDDVRLEALAQRATGFVYYISIAGITGAGSAKLETLETRTKHLKNHLNLPIAVGFGVRTPERTAQIGAFADAVVVGSALVEVIAHTDPAHAAREASICVNKLAFALRASNNS